MQQRVSGERRGRRKQQHVIVMRAQNRGDGDESIAAGTILDHDRLPPFRRKLVGQQASRDVDPRGMMNRTVRCGHDCDVCACAIGTAKNAIARKRWSKN